MNDEYVIAEQDGEELGCYRCDSEAPTIGVIGAHLAEKRDGDERAAYFRICKFCSETELGAIIAYPRRNPELVTLARGLCQALNIVHWEGKKVETVRWMP